MFGAKVSIICSRTALRAGVLTPDKDVGALLLVEDVVRRESLIVMNSAESVRNSLVAASTAQRSASIALIFVRNGKMSCAVTLAVERLL